MTFRSVRAIGLRLPGVEEGTMYGTPALKLGKKWIACWDFALDVLEDSLPRERVTHWWPRIYPTCPARWSCEA